MNNVYAFVVGIDRYDQPDWTIPGPCANALAVTEWLLKVHVPPKNIFVFLESKEEILDDAIQKLKNEDVVVSRSANWDVIDTFWRSRLQKERQADSRLFIYWSGHGFADNDGSRIFICPDYTNAHLKTRVFNGTNVLRHLRAAAFQSFSEQIFLADVCAVKANVEIVAAKDPPPNQVKNTRQVAFFATPEGTYAHGNNGRGVFTEVALNVLSEFKCWPELATFTKSMNDAFGRIKHAIFRVGYRDGETDISDRLVGMIPKETGNAFFDSVYSLLSKVELPDSVYRPHFLRTVSDLGAPELYKAQGLTGMIRELASLRDSTGPGHVPHGLLQFLVRLAKEEELTTPISTWLTENAAGQGNALANVKQKLDEEGAVKILVVEVTNNEKGEIAAFELFVRTQDLIPVPGITYPRRTLKDWTAFCMMLLADIQDLQTRYAILDFEIHFLVDPPLFDRCFHGITLAGGGTLGEQHVVLLRHRDRLRSAPEVLRNTWRNYAETLRPGKPSELKLVPVNCAAGSEKSLLPKEKGLCYTSFVVQTNSGASSSISAEKQTLLRLLRMGVPYLYWLHSIPVPKGMGGIESEFAEWLQDIATLDRFPNVFTEKRNSGNQFASEATLLWDDPQFNPFRNTRGVKIL
jgi:hypothetical protein